jgi:hypothetical protein
VAQIERPSKADVYREVLVQALTDRHASGFFYRPVYPRDDSFSAGGQRCAGEDGIRNRISGVAVLDDSNPRESKTQLAS